MRNLLFSQFYPASGYRNDGSGGLGNVGLLGYAWSSSPLSATSMNGSSLYFDSSAVGPEYYNSRSLGRPVRCVQE